MLWCSPPMKAFISLSEFGTIFGHKSANSWNLLTSKAILIGQEPFQFSPGDPISLFYSDRLGVCIPPGQGIVSQSLPVANVTLFSSAQLLRENTDSVRISLGPVFLLGLSAFAMAVACASRAAKERNLENQALVIVKNTGDGSKIAGKK
ncbi:hypothetical protein Tco_1517935 [Tanacetum coccineum]